jgi:magnesium and cobalt transporter
MSEDRSSNNKGSNKSWLERFFSDEPESHEDIKDFLREAQIGGLLDEDALNIMEGAIHVSDMKVRDIMVPFSQVTCVQAGDQLEDFLGAIIASAHSRFPVINDNDEVLGILLAKDLLPLLLNNGAQRFQLKEVLRPAVFVPESKRLNVLLKEFRENRNHMAVVIDEYGNMAGLVTIEDVLEQIVGEIEDEHDIDEEESLIKPVDKCVHMVKAVTPIEDFNKYFETDFSVDDFDTIGGIVINRFGRLPDRDEQIQIGQHRFKVVNANNRRIHLLKVTKAET